jgi:prepilin-type N-terminal cleavage/methylation domain-containing protein
MHTQPRYGHAAFSLIEMMAVITIIVILASLVVGGMGFVTERQAKEKAKIQMGLISNALEKYKLDFGSYPATTNSPKGEDNSKILFKALYWDSDNDGQGAPIGNATGDTDQNIYLPQLDPANNNQGWTSGTPSLTTKILDPWGKEYRYRSALDASGKPNTNTLNPDFDLWSIGKDGKTNPATPTDKVNRDDIKSP